MLPQSFCRIRKYRIVVVAATFFFILTATAASSNKNGGDDGNGPTQRGLINSTTAVVNVSADTMVTDVENVNKQSKKSSGVLNSYLQGVGVQSLQNTVNKIRPPPPSITRAPAYNPASEWRPRPRPQRPPEIDYFNPPTTRRYYRPDHLPPEIDYFNPPTTRRYYRPEQPPQGIDYFNQPTTRRYYRPDQLSPEINYFNPPTTNRYYRPEPPPPAPPPIDYYEQVTTQRYHRPEPPTPPPVTNNHEQTTRKYYSPELGPAPVRTEAPPKVSQTSTTATGADSLFSLTPPSVFKTEEQKQAYQFLLLLEEQERQQAGKGQTLPPTTTKPPKPKLPHIIEIATTPEYDEYDDPDYGEGNKRISATAPPTRKPRPVTPSAGNAPPPAYKPYQPPLPRYPQLENPTSRPSDRYHENFKPTSAEIASPVATPLPPLTPEQLHRIQLILSIMKLREKQKEESPATQPVPGEGPPPPGSPTQSSPFEFVPRLVINPYIPPTRLTTTTDNPSDAIQDLANLFGSLAVGNLAGVVDGTLKFAGTGVFNNLNTWNACNRGNCDQDDVKAGGSVLGERPRPTAPALPIPPHRHPVQNPYPGSVPGS